MPSADYKRESVYLTDEEQAALERLSRSLNVSKNGVFKILIREAAGMPLPDEYLTRLRERASGTLF